MALSMQQIADKVTALKARNATRDAAMADILAVRKGNLESVAPDLFPEGMTKSMVANFVDVAARDSAEVLAPLPSFNCATANTTSDRAKKSADKRTMIANNYVQFSKLQTQMYTGADWFNTYAGVAFVVEPDLEARMPRIVVDNPLGGYPEFDRYGRLVSYTKRYMKTLRELVVDFPEYESNIIGPLGRDNVDMNSFLELIRYEDKDQIVLFLPDRGNMPLSRVDNPMGKLTVKYARRPSLDPSEPRGQFDDVLWVQLARARFALLAMDAAEKSVQAPLAVPMDVQEFAFGPDAVLRSQNPQAIRRVGLELPTAAFTEQAALQAEMRLGARYPEGRTGNIDASIITGQGVQALLGAFDSQIKAGQQILAEVLEDVISLCFEMDEKLFPGEKQARGVYQGANYDFTYNPTSDIKGDYTVQVRYGLMSGLDPSRALIFSLQAMQANLVSRDFVMRELPWSMNVGMEQERIDIEKMRDALTTSLLALSQAIPQMAGQGADPSGIVKNIADVIEARKKGSSIEEAVQTVFAPPAPEPEAPVSPAGEAPVEQAATPTSAAAPAEAAPAGAPTDIAAILAQLGG